MCHDFREVLRCDIVGVRLPMKKSVEAAMDDAIKMRSPVRYSCDYCLCFVNSVIGSKTENLHKKRHADRLSLRQTQLVLHGKCTDATKRVNSKNLLGLRVALKM